MIKYTVVKVVGQVRKKQTNKWQQIIASYATNKKNTKIFKRSCY